MVVFATWAFSGRLDAAESTYYLFLPKGHR